MDHDIQFEFEGKTYKVDIEIYETGDFIKIPLLPQPKLLVPLSWEESYPPKLLTWMVLPVTHGLSGRVVDAELISSIQDFDPEKV
jgi:hypothetical protein